MTKNDTIVKTPEGVDVTERIKDGRTAFFVSKLDAEKYATDKRSYSYPLCNNKYEHIGYGVPK